MTKEKQPGSNEQILRYEQILPRPNQEELENINIPIRSKEIEIVNKNLPTNKSLGPYTSHTNSIKHLEKN